MIKRSEYQTKDILISFLIALIPTGVSFYYFFGKLDIISIFFNTLFAVYIPVLSYSLAKRVAAVKPEKLSRILPPIIFRLLLGIVGTLVLIRPFVNKTTVFIEILSYYLLGVVFLFFEIGRKKDHN